MLKIFSDEWVDSIKERYKQHKDYEKPEIYSIAVSDIAYSLRRELEEMFVLMSPTEQQEIIPRLRQNEHFTNTYHELVVGHQLNKLGYTIEYNKNFKGLTPDWYIHSKGECQDFIVEVFTTRYGGNERIKEDLQIKNLKGRLREIPVGAILTIRLDEHIVLDSRDYKQISKEIEQWLLQENPLTNQEYSGRGFTCHIERKSFYSKIYPIIIHKNILVDTNPLRKTIEQKVAKYKKIGLPLVIAVATDPILGMLLKSELLERIDAKRFDHKLRYGQLNEGLFWKKTSLSVVLLIGKGLGGWQMNAIYNPAAKKPLPDDTFGETNCSIFSLFSRES